MAYRRSRNRDVLSVETVAGAVVAGLLASLVFGALLVATGDLAAVAALYGLEGRGAGWALVLAHGFLGAGPFVVGVTRSARHRAAPTPVAAAVRSPFVGGCFGAAYGTLCWLGLVAYGLPFLIGLTGGALSPPYHHPASLVALLGYGATLGAWYPLVRTTITARQRPQRLRR